MRIRTRKLIGAAALLAIAVAWPLVMLGLGYPAISRFYAPAQIIFFLMLGLVWIVPAGMLIRWMQRPDKN